MTTIRTISPDRPATRRAGGLRALYVSYDGMTSLLGQSQIWPYIRGLSAAGHRFDVLSFEQPERRRRIGDKVARDLAGLGADWHPRPFRSRPPVLAKLLDLRRMKADALRIAAGGIDVVHARSSVAADAALAVKRRHGVPFIFDSRGFWADERRDSGRWPDSSVLHRRLYRQWKAKEDGFVAEAQQIVVLSEAARAVLERSPAYRGQPIAVIPCAIDHRAFPLRTEDSRAAARARLGVDPAATVLVHLGSIGPLYLPAEMLRFYARMRRARGTCRFLFIGWHSHDELAALIRDQGLDIPAGEILVQPAEHAEVPGWLAAADLAIALRKPGFSSLGVSPVKLAEYLACGLPVVANDGTGDVRAIIEELGAGAVLSSTTPAEMDAVAARLDQLLALPPERIRERSARIYDMPVALRKYRDVYAAAAAAGKTGGGRG